MKRKRRMVVEIDVLGRDFLLYFVGSVLYFKTTRLCIYGTRCLRLLFILFVMALYA